MHAPFVILKMICTRVVEFSWQLLARSGFQIINNAHYYMTKSAGHVCVVHVLGTSTWESMEMVSSSSSSANDNESPNDPILKKICVLLCVPQNAPTPLQ